MKGVIVALIILFVAVLISASFKSKSPTPIAQSLWAEPKLSQSETKTDSSGEVFVEAKPLKIDAQGLQFELNITTHSKDLSEDLVSTSKLIAAGGEVSPIKWEGDPPGRHHRKGVLFFEGDFLPRLNRGENSKSIKLIIESIGGEKKEFEWIK